MTKQLPIQFEYRANQNFETFYPGCNQEIISHLQACINNNEEPFIFIWGPTGRGKSHLLQACYQHAFELDQQAFYLAHSHHPKTAILDGLEAMDLVCIDDIDDFIGQPDWEQALFNLFNRLRADNKRLIIASRQAPGQLAIHLNDLKTRLAWGLTLKIAALSDVEMIKALQLKAHTLGFEISDQSGHYLLSHYSRDHAELWQLLHRLDYETLVAQRKVTIPFLKKLLSL